VRIKAACPAELPAPTMPERCKSGSGATAGTHFGDIRLILSQVGATRTLDEGSRAQSGFMFSGDELVNLQTALYAGRRIYRMGS
jgi:hypothetical protein